MTVTEMMPKTAPVKSRFPIESLLSARLLLAPRVVGDKVYFLSDFGGVLSLYSMDKTGGIPQPLLPGGQALVNPHLMIGDNFVVLPKLGKVLVMIDKMGNENYQPSFVPLEGGIPEPVLGADYDNQQIASIHCDIEKDIAYFYHDNRRQPETGTLRVNLETSEVVPLGRSPYGNFCNGVSSDHSMVVLADGYTAGDTVLYYWKPGMKERELLYGIPLEKREGKQVPPSGIGWCSFVDGDKGLVFRSSLFHDTGGLTYMSLDNPSNPVDVPVEGTIHSGVGELVQLRQVEEELFVLEYNIDGAAWCYEAEYQHGSPQRFKVTKTLCGIPPLANGVMLGLEWEVKKDPLRVEYVLSFTKADSPSQLYLYSEDSNQPRRLSAERVLGIPERYLSEGEDATYKSFDGLRVSARLYFPSKELGYAGPRPVVLYVHGGPQGQERPDFTWFSMPLIQHLTLNGFAVFVPNVRGSTGYGMRYMKMVDRDWGGKDAQDQIEGLKHLEKDQRIDSTRRGVVGRSYGGYMTLTLASRHPHLWKAAVDMFGPYDLPTWASRVPPSWMPYIKLAIGDPEKERDFLLERSPMTYLQNLKCPLMIIQGKHDPRVPEPESAELVADMRKRGISVDYLVFEDEGHDVLRFKNRVLCYNTITDFFQKHLGP
ncbi:MAG TPA: S9 family peptidase [Candidatus Bathyarchaeia archaeon]|nr:S9 family peptidase [Candidatus Bathyarchaeia archaeon]